MFRRSWSYRLTPLLAALLALPAAASHFGGRDDVAAFIADMHERHGFPTHELDRLFDRAASLPSVIAAVMPPKDPGVRSWHSYRGRFVEPKRIAAGLAFWHRHAGALARAQETFGVPEEIVLAIIGVETIYGKHTGRYRTFDALATLAFDYPPRAELFRGELEALLLLARSERRDPLAYKGSYAGALGLPQFLPSSRNRWGTDFDRNGRIDLDNAVDAIGSVARFLVEHGWQKDGPVAVPAGVNGDVAALIDAGIRPQTLPAEMAGVEAAAAPAAPAALIDLVTPAADTEYWIGYQNFYVLTRYNRSSFYAMAVFQLAQALKEARDRR